MTTYLCRNVLQEILPKNVEVVYTSFNIEINGKIHPCQESPLNSKFFDYNLLGANYFVSNRLVCEFNYATYEVSIKENK
jgi:hypothetical protein